jgi:hypothetical protein
MSVQRAFGYRGGTNGSLEEYYDDEGIKYIVKWEIKNRLDNWVKEKLKDTLNLTEDKYLNFGGIATTSFGGNETKANKFFEDLTKILNEQYDYWDSII